MSEKKVLVLHTVCKRVLNKSTLILNDSDLSAVKRVLKCIAIVFTWSTDTTVIGSEDYHFTNLKHRYMDTGEFKWHNYLCMTRYMRLID